MNKTVTINISGIIFHIEEDAYDKLSKYLNTIKGYFSKTEGGNEIMNDIEARIAEMLQSKTSQVKQVVLMTDVDSVIEAMGKPEEFAESNEQESTKSDDTNNEENETPIKKRLFRDPENKAVGGVCAGIAAYFDVDLVWIRLAMFLLIFFGGLSLWVYIILWIVIPEAKTRAEKLAMRGEKIDINNISKTVKEEAEQLKQRAKKYGSDIKNNSKDFRNDTRNFFEKLADFIKDFLIIFSKFFARIIGLVLLIFGVVFMLGLMSSIFGFSIAGTNTEFNDWINIFFMERSHYTLGLLGVCLFFGIPFIMMIYGGVKLLFKIHYTNRWMNLSAGLVWFVGLIIVAFVAITTGKDFSESGKIKEPVSLSITSDTMYLKLTENKELMSRLRLNEEDLEDYDDEGNHIKIHKRHSDYVVVSTGKNKKIVGYASLNILPSSTEHFELYVVKKARGENKRMAIERARAISYQVVQNDNTIYFDRIFTVDGEEKFRVQDIQVILKVPRGKVIHLDKSLDGFIYDVENVHNTYDGDMVGRRWIMNSNGLQCVDCEGIHFDDEDKLSPPPSPPNPPTHIETENANVKIDGEGIKINSREANVHIHEKGIQIDTKSEKEQKDEKGVK